MSNPTAFALERHLVQDEKDPQKTRAEMGRLNPFGGGSSICKGRYFAEREVMLFVALFLTAWEFKPVGAKWKLPKDSLTEAGSANPRIVVRMTRRGGLQVCRIRTEVDEVAR